MKQLFFGALLLIGFISQAQDSDYEHITSFDSKIIVQKDCKVEITETIRVYSEGIQINHGIYREIPLSYDFEGGTTTVEFTLKSISKDGEPEDYHTEDLSNGIRMYLGSKNSSVSNGYHTYVIKYVTNYVLNTTNKDYDEFYWNVNGTGWLFTIDTITASLTLPTGSKTIGVKAYTGYQGQAGSNYISETSGNTTTFSTTQALSPGENMTIAVSWNKNQVIYPSGFDQWLYWIRSHILLVISILGLLFLVIKNFFTWNKYGRDPKPGTIMPQYEAPSEISPAEAYVILHEGRTSATAFTAQIISLAEKGYMTIDVTGNDGSRRYEFKRTEGKLELFKTEQSFLNDLFSGSDTVVFTEGTYNPSIKADMDKLFENITVEHGENYRLLRSGLKAKQYIPLFIFALLGVISKWMYGGNWLILGGFIILSIGINVLYGYLYEQPTPEGRKMLDHLEGFKLYMKYADQQRIKFANPPSMNFQHFENNLPYAIALGVSKEWSKQFDPKELEAGFNGYYGGHMWYTAAMFHGMHNFDFQGLSNTVTSASIPPSSSGSSGSSFGGGFSGGGGGGGGGGGW